MPSTLLSALQTLTHLILTPSVRQTEAINIPILKRRKQAGRVINPWWTRGQAKLQSLVFRRVWCQNQSIPWPVAASFAAGMKTWTKGNFQLSLSLLVRVLSWSWGCHIQRVIDCMLVPSPEFWVETHSPVWWYLQVGLWGGDEVMHRMCAFMRKARETSNPPLPSEHIARRTVSVIQEEGPARK